MILTQQLILGILVGGLYGLAAAGLSLGVGAAMFVLGLVHYWVLFQFVVKAHEELRIKNSLLIGFGLTLVLHTLAIRFWTADERAVTTAYAGAVMRIGAFTIPLVRLSSLVLAFAILMALH